MVAYLVAEELGMDVAHVRVVAADTDLCPVDLGAYSSRVTFMVGNAAIDAARAAAARSHQVCCMHRRHSSGHQHAPPIDCHAIRSGQGSD